MRILRTYWLPLACVLVALLKLALCAGMPLCVHASATYDDAWAVRAADFIAQGQWLGPYDDVTLTKRPGFALWLALCTKLGMGYLVPTAVLYVLACVLFSQALRPLVESDGWFFALFALLPERLLQLEQNKELIKDYVNQAAAAGFTGLFCQISDPVDLLCRSAFLQAGGALLPEQLRGFGLGVMKARAAYAADKLGADFSHGAAFGPHGDGLVIANHPTAYDDGLSRQLTAAAVSANLRVRDLGFKPYVAPALSSACLSLLNTLKGEWSLTTVPMDGIYFGCENRLTRQGPELRRQPLDPALLARIRETWTKLKEADRLCRP